MTAFAKNIEIDRPQFRQLQGLQNDGRKAMQIPSLAIVRRNGQEDRLRRPGTGDVEVEGQTSDLGSTGNDLDPLVYGKPADRLRGIEFLRDVRNQRETTAQRSRS